MGLMAQTRDDAERLAQQERNAQRGYRHDVREIKQQAAPDEALVKDYNAQVEGFKQSAIYKDDGALWQIVGYLGGQSAPTMRQPVNYPGGWNIPGAPEASSVRIPTVDGKNAGIYVGSGVNPQMMYGYYEWGNSPVATLRDASGAPIRTWQSSADSVTPVQAYATRNDRPFVAPVSQSQIDTAKAADTRLIDLGTQAEARTAAYEKTAGLIASRADRLALDSEMLQNRARGESQPIGAQSVFEQNTNVFQSIADWLK